MTHENAPDDSDLLKKTGARAQQGAELAADVSRVFISTTAEVLGGVAHASAEAFQTLNSHLAPEQVAASGFTTKLVEGLLKGNARFFDELSHSTERVAEIIRSRQKAEPETADEGIDYERLAREVVTEMQRRAAATAADEPHTGQ